MYRVVLVIFCGLVAIPAFAQDKGEMNPDRPDLTPNSYVIEKGTIGIEAGLLFKKDAANGNEVKTHAYPSVRLRYGLLDKLELLVQGVLKDSVVQNGERRKYPGAGNSTTGYGINLNSDVSESILFA